MRGANIVFRFGEDEKKKMWHELDKHNTEFAIIAGAGA